jgi:hypothetical protein
MVPASSVMITSRRAEALVSAFGKLVCPGRVLRMSQDHGDRQESLSYLDRKHEDSGEAQYLEDLDRVNIGRGCGGSVKQMTL